METALTPHTQTASAPHRWTAVTGVVNPIGDHSRARRLLKIAGAIAVAAAVLAILDAAGVDVWGWLAGLWHTLGSVSLPYLVAAIALQTVGSAFYALAWLFILRSGYAHADIRFFPILAAYATGAALNAVLPANLGTLVMLFMFVAIIPGGTVPGVFAALVVQKIFFTVMAVLVYVYLFATVPGSFSVDLGWLRTNPVLETGIGFGAVLLVAAVIRFFWPKLKHLWAQAKEGGAIIGSPRRYLVEVALPSLAGYVAKLGVVAVMLAAFAIPVSFNSVMHVVAGNSVATNVAATPGGAGVTQAISVVALRDYADPQTANAYSVAQQLVGTAWNIGLALILVLTVFGWTDGAALVKSSYAKAKQRAAERHGGPAPEADAQ